MVRPSTSHAADPTAVITARLCPYLLAEDGGWRAAVPARDHRCTAVAPPAIVATEKQRRLCLTTEHRSCATYLAAGGAGGRLATDPGVGEIASLGATTDRVRPPLRPSARTVVRTAPVVLDHGRIASSLPALRGSPRWGQASLVGLMIVAFAAILFARLPLLGAAGSETGGPTPTAVGPARTAGTDGAAATVRPAATHLPARTLVPTEAGPSPHPSAAPVASPAKPAPTSAAPTSYKVKRGDTLSGIATRVGTTWQVLAELNGITNPGRLRVGQVLQLP